MGSGAIRRQPRPAANARERPPTTAGARDASANPRPPAHDGPNLLGYPARVTVRDPGYDPRSPRRRLGARRTDARGAGSGGLLAAVGVIALVLVIGLGFGGGLLGRVAATPDPPGALATDGSSAPVPSSALPSSTPPPADPSPTATPTPTATPEPTPATVSAAIVPVTSFRSTEERTGWSDLRGIVDGAGTFSALVLVQRDADAVLAALRLDRSALGKRLVVVPDADALAADLASNRTRLGFLRADEVTAAVRALAWGSRSLFGVGRVTDLGAWPLVARLEPAGDGVPVYDPATAWTLFAGGDILLDRGVALAIQGSSAGPDFPFDGGTASITGHCKDCSPLGWDLPYTKRTGNAGSVRDLVSGADIAIANFENPAPDKYRFHAHGTVFSANPAYIAGLAAAGIDWVSLANNHIGDAGRTAILQTMANLDKRGIAHSGAGRNTAAAHTAALLEAGGKTVAILGYDTIAADYSAGTSTPGSARMTTAALKADIAAARKAGADLVIVFPHWGVEYRAKPTVTQQRLAHAAIDAGADLVIGNHPHWAGAMEIYKGKPIWYALGNFVFDQTWSEPTMEGITLELTFRGTDLVQVRIRPHLILDRAQPNFMDPATDGKVVMTQMFNASKGLLDW